MRRTGVAERCEPVKRPISWTDVGNAPLRQQTYVVKHIVDLGRRLVDRRHPDTLALLVSTAQLAHGADYISCEGDVKTTCWFVHDQNIWVLEKFGGDRQPLPLAATYTSSKKCISCSDLMVFAAT